MLKPAFILCLSTATALMPLQPAFAQKDGHALVQDVYKPGTEIEFDEDFIGGWKKIDADPIKEESLQTEIKINIKRDVRQWIETKNIQLETLMENLLEGFYQAQKKIPEK